MKNMKKILALISLCLGLYFNNFSQSIDVNWSSMRNYENKKDGFFDQYIGANSKYVYAKFHKMAWKPNKANSKIKIVAYDKKTMEISSSKAIIGYKENEGSKDKYQGLEFYKGIPVENSVYLFWYKKLKGNYELYAEVLDSKLNEKIKLKKVYEVINKGKKWDPNLFVVGNEKASENIVIGAELPRDKGQNVKFEYKVLKSDLSFDAANQITLPYSTESKFGLTSAYELGDNGFLYIKTDIRMDKDERANLKKHESPNYSNLAVLNLSTGKLSTNAFKFDDKNLFYLDYLVTPNSVKVFAFFCDLLKDPKGRDSHGIFYGEIDNATNSMTKTNFTYFDKETLTKLFEKDKKDNHKSGIFSSKKSKKSDDESLADDYVIEEVQSLDKDNIVLFCSRMNNWSTTTCDSKGNCTTHY